VTREDQGSLGQTYQTASFTGMLAKWVDLEDGSLKDLVNQPVSAWDSFEERL